MPTQSKLQTSDPQTSLQLKIAQKIFGSSVIDGANYDPQIVVEAINPETSYTAAKITIRFDLDNAWLEGINTNSVKLIENTTPELKLTPTFENNDTVIRFGLSFKVKK